MLFFSTATGQQLYKVSQFMEHSFLQNPAAVGANGSGTVGGAYRSQWSGIEGGPVTAVLFADKYFAKMNTGLGIVLYSDKTGPTSRTGGELNLSYSVHLGGDKRLMIGLGGQVIQFRVDKSKIAASLPNDPLLASSGSTIKGDANAGIYYRSNTLNVGISAKQLIQPKLGFIKTAANPKGMLYRQYFLAANYYIRTDEANVLLPHVEVRYQPEAPVDYEGGLILYHKDLLHFGFSAHYRQDYTVFLGVKIKHKLTIGYAYDIYNNPVSTFESGFGAHEIMLRYAF
ncbi:MAG: PorP/SprF family type IX secretion system membrane protein [Chitinophagaceae bacterium]|nr:PorP/SprF family type IX secretion system membrane protein [Chitinophagaceae bacterium]